MFQKLSVCIRQALVLMEVQSGGYSDPIIEATVVAERMVAVP